MAMEDRTTDDSKQEKKDYDPSVGIGPDRKRNEQVPTSPPRTFVACLSDLAKIRGSDKKGMDQVCLQR